jgi:hypothetical protein
VRSRTHAGRKKKRKRCTMAILCHRWWPLQESVFFALEGEPVLDAGHALYCSTYYSRAVSVARSHITHITASQFPIAISTSDVQCDNQRLLRHSYMRFTTNVHAFPDSFSRFSQTLHHRVDVPTRREPSFGCISCPWRGDVVTDA